MNTGTWQISVNIEIDSNDNLFVGTDGTGTLRSQDYGETWVNLCCTDGFIWFIDTSLNGTVFVATNCCRNAGDMDWQHLSFNDKRG